MPPTKVVDEINQQIAALKEIAAVHIAQQSEFNLRVSRVTEEAKMLVAQQAARKRELDGVLRRVNESGPSLWAECAIVICTFLCVVYAGVYLATNHDAWNFVGVLVGVRLVVSSVESAWIVLYEKGPTLDLVAPLKSLAFGSLLLFLKDSRRILGVAAGLSAVAAGLYMICLTAVTFYVLSK